MAMYRSRRQIIVGPDEDLVTPIGVDQLTVDLIRTPKGLTAYARPFSNSSISEAAWKGTTLERRKWEGLLREAIIASVGALAKRIEVSISRGPPWLERMLERMSFRLAESWTRKSWVMAVNIEEKGK